MGQNECIARMLNFPGEAAAQLNVSLRIPRRFTDSIFSPFLDAPGQKNTMISSFLFQEQPTVSLEDPRNSLKSAL